jgi:acetyl-CoA/propionyl-CoA carboxylase, biotin carboxylase, biotin carboxyl carrier protein
MMHNQSGPGPKMFRTVLVANRGEIACRVIRTLRTMGIRSVAVYSDADAAARHVREADAAVRIGPAAAADSYLNIGAIVDACRRTGAGAVHPGYGFLSENAEFAEALAAANITFIGPPVESLRVMGDKIRSKNHVRGYGVPVVPGVAEPGLTDQELAKAAGTVGFPLLIKPSAGGGGKGMHIVERPEELDAALAAARRLAAGAFGDDTLFLERLVPAPRHIEVQVLADNYGHVIHLGERECSLQRRHQKVIEEAPSALLDALPDGGSIRDRIGEAACNAARSVNYSGAGTVEFLISDDAPGEFFFMEMNTRLQVEHPVTEMVTGLDLVEWQVRVAAGEELGLSQSDVVLNGHAVEARVYAESPERNFLPSAGRVLLLQERPPLGQDAGTVRIDSALAEGVDVSSSYDPLLSKVIAWGQDRKGALDALDRALAGYTVLGVDTNVEYLRLLINDDDVRAGRLDTTLIERKMPGFRFRQAGDAELVAAALFAQKLEQQELEQQELERENPWRRKDGWRLGPPAARRISLGTPAGATVTVRLIPGSASVPGRVRLEGGREYEARLECAARETPHPQIQGRGQVVLWLDGERTQYSIAAEGTEGHPDALILGQDGWSCRLEVLSREARLARVLAAIERKGGAVDPEIRSPMPGTVVSVAVASGATVEAGQLLLAVEAMKMEHQLVAPSAGTVRLAVQAGEPVKANQVLATIHPQETASPEPPATPNLRPPRKSDKGVI